ncbi:siderophore biosynthesis protein [Nitrosococcus halophilus Nc 4]|uniref:Siderophore biosynthesis protein n=1 Tax=Nitrosococcus halophilus (strain Nc4) TaxID=472759 RepID=D5C317_NITHN|nr:GNAT family N-acetyltransferase [Nitrosococcus halophilus]ADE14909.1 siderophore biosynthesis protein [Nitrosococcus halophilus Nc 4]
MAGNKDITVPLPSGRQLTVEQTGTVQRCLLEDRQLLGVEANPEQPHRLRVFRTPDCLSALRSASYALFVGNPAVTVLVFDRADGVLIDPALMFCHAAQQWHLYRDALWQWPELWLQGHSHSVAPTIYRMGANGHYHPLRPARPEGEVYRRFDYQLGAWVSLRTLEINEDLERFHRWQNSERVACFWEEQGTLEQHQGYLQRLFDDPRVLPLIGCINNEPFAYFEVYWAKEDRIAPYYQADDYDRGIHMLVGEESHRGPHKVKAWLTALCHYLFLDDPRTQRIVSEPRFDNQKMISYLQAYRFAKIKEFDFPHKRASLMILTREAFFDRCTLG